MERIHFDTHLAGKIEAVWLECGVLEMALMGRKKDGNQREVESAHHSASVACGLCSFVTELCRIDSEA